MPYLDRERWCSRTYLQGSRGDSNIDSRLVDTEGKERARGIERVPLEHIHTICKIDGGMGICCVTQGVHTWCSMMT